ncbi:unnamed protein product [Protopolystoma xenopodis]|uniref:Uncharacterized protein n=1 Tax=Protopolystoma xenopodis TaxID=117903 RepID=A0A3S5A5L2_9PLAT|nr:unnamed protein product [Protopolystoma xenopodis]
MHPSRHSSMDTCSRLDGVRNWAARKHTHSTRTDGQAGRQAQPIATASVWWNVIGGRPEWRLANGREALRASLSLSLSLSLSCPASPLLSFSSAHLAALSRLVETASRGLKPLESRLPTRTHLPASSGDVSLRYRLRVVAIGRGNGVDLPNVEGTAGLDRGVPCCAIRRHVMKRHDFVLFLCDFVVLFLCDFVVLSRRTR